MKLTYLSLALSIVAAPSLCHATEPVSPVAATTEASYSTSVAPIDTALTTGAAAGGQAMANGKSVHAFSTAAVAVKFGVAGAGFEVATPLSASKFNLRGSASFLGASPSFTVSGITINSSLTFRTVNASVDYYPWGGSFRISPGLTIYNGNHITAAALVPAGSTFTLDDVDYVSQASNPVTGAFDMKFGNKVAPTLTIGWGNLISRKPTKHWSVPFELGVQFNGAPTATLALAGNVCQRGTTNCSSVATDPTVQSNLKVQVQRINDDIAPLRTYPILSIGVGYKF